MKYIIGNIQGGFGNKIFDLVILLYIQYLNGGNIYIYINKSKHDSIHDKSVFDVFNKLRNKFIILNKYREIGKIEEKVSISKRLIFNYHVKSMDDFKINKNYEYIYVADMWKFYEYIYYLYNNLPQEIKNLFLINKNIISDKILKITKEKYMMIHIRYGDKLIFSSQNNEKYILYSPRFYKHIIKKFMKKNIKIYIITDDVNIVQKFILDDIKYNNIELLDIPWWDAFYCLTKSKYTILSISSFSIMATMLNNNLKKAYSISKPEDNLFTKAFVIDEDKIVQYANWKQINNKRKYILNYDKKLINLMLTYK